MSFLKTLFSINKNREQKLIAKFLNQITNVSIGFSEIIFINYRNFENEQIGYRVDLKGGQLFGDYEGMWDENWFVIATDDLGDPIFVDRSDYYLPVYSAIHGEGEWTPVLLSISLEEFKKTLNLLDNISKGRETPDLMERNPIPEKEFKKIIRTINKNNPEVMIDWWESFLTYEDD